MFTCFIGTNLGAIFMATKEYISQEFSKTFTTEAPNIKNNPLVYSFLGNIFELVYIDIIHITEPMKCLQKD